MNRYVGALALSMWVLLERPAGAAAPEVARFAIVMGNNRGEAGNGAELRYADDDAVATHKLLQEAGVDSVLLTVLDQEDDIWVGGALVNSSLAVLLHFDGVTWSSYQFPYGMSAIKAIWGRATDDVWAVGQGGSAFHWAKPAGVADFPACRHNRGLAGHLGQR
jgi:hypothetical protein